MIDPKRIEPYLDQALAEIDLPGLPGHYRGKVRDNYDLPGGRRLIVASDRLSAFDRILTSVPLKGQVLTQTARYWFEQTKDICPNHVIAYPDPNVVLARRLDILPIEIVVRDYLAGSTGTSIWPMYKSGKREMYGHKFPDGMRANQKLPATIITPTTKAFDAGHDEPLAALDIFDRGLLSRADWNEVLERALALFEFGKRIAASRGLILVDTKYEFGRDADGRIILADEIHTPDSSRYWFAANYAARFEAGQPPESFDKDFVRNWVNARCDPYKGPIPEIPRDIRLQAAAIYIDVFEKITGEPFAWPDPATSPMARIRAALKSFA